MTAKIEDLTISISVNKSAAEAYKAINNVRDWWVGDITGTSDKEGAEFTYRYKEFHVSTQKLTKLIPNQKITWLVTHSEINFVKDKKEWLNTEIIFEIIPEGSSSRINFTHKGLTPKIECYNDCTGGWDFYINKSLKSYIETGKGIDPNF